MERPRIFLDTKTTASLTFVDLVAVKISDDAKGLSYFNLSIDPDPNALYNIIIAKILNVLGLEITAIWTVELEHLTQGVYQGFLAGDTILVRHRSTNGTPVKTAYSLIFNEVVV